MTLAERIGALLYLGDYLREKDERLHAYIHRTYHKNKWFTIENQYASIDAICAEFLTEKKLLAWVKTYSISENNSIKNIGLIPAANIPLVWFHDLMCIFISGHKSVVKLSERDSFVLPFFIQKMEEEFPQIKNYFSFPDNIPVDDLDAMIATGSNNSSRYFESYFGHLKNIIRRNRSSIAVLSGNETKEELNALGKDITLYYGLGCRNVSKLYVPKGYDFNPALEALHDYNNVILHDKYKNNYDYQTTILILNKQDYWNSGSIIFTKSESNSSPISVVHYEEYETVEEIQKNLSEKENEIQCIVSNSKLENKTTVPFGQAQSPSLFDYADGVDTMKFLLAL